MWLWVQHNSENSMALEQVNRVTAQVWNRMPGEQHSCEVALEWHPTLARQPCSTPVQYGLLPSALLHSASSALFQWEVGEMQFLVEGKVCSLSQRNDDLYREKFLPRSLIGPSFCKRGLQVLVVWLVYKAVYWLVRMKLHWFVGEDANEDIAA